MSQPSAATTSAARRGAPPASWRVGALKTSAGLRLAPAGLLIALLWLGVSWALR